MEWIMFKTIALCDFEKSLCEHHNCFFFFFLGNNFLYLQSWNHKKLTKINDVSRVFLYF